MSRKGSVRAPSGVDAGRQKSPEGGYASTRMLLIYRPMRSPNEYKTLNLELNQIQNSIFLTAKQGTKNGDFIRIPFRLTVAEALELAFKLRFAVRKIIEQNLTIGEKDEG